MSENASSVVTVPPEMLSRVSTGSSARIEAPEPLDEWLARVRALPKVNLAALPATERWVEGGWRHPERHPFASQVRFVDRTKGIVQLSPIRKKVAIVGFASSSRQKAPYDDPEWEIWGLNQLYRYLPRFDRWFEIHNRQMFLADTVRDTNYLGWLQQTTVPVYMMAEEAPYADIPCSVRFPLERAIAYGGQDYFTSSIAFMFALACLEGFTTIGVYGVDLIVGDEYFYQKPCLEWWIGFARGRGIEVVLPDETALTRQHRRYGVPEGPKTGLHRPWMEARLAAYNEKREEVLTTLNNLDGVIAEYRQLITALLNEERGTSLPPAVPDGVL